MRAFAPWLVVAFLSPLAAASLPRHGAAPAAIAVQQPPSPQERVFRSSTRTVAVYVTVTDTAGLQVPNLTRDDFEVYDNGKRQTITLFESGVQPITVVLMLD